MTLPPPHIAFMQRALALAAQAQGWVSPNPMVGCVIVKNNQIIAQGKHLRFGGPHAEINALQNARKHNICVQNSDIYVTLEPCCHHGKTPPCTQALLAAKPKRLFAAMIDPFPKVAGQGIKQLQNAGIITHVGLCEPQAKFLNRAFLKHLATALPWVTAKWAQTLDGKLATSTGDSRWISNPQSRKLVHHWRSRTDAIMVAINTVLLDNPLLTARDVPLRRIAHRIILDPHLRIPLSCQLIQSLKQPAPAPVTLGILPSVLRQNSRKLLQLQRLNVTLLPFQNLKQFLRLLSQTHQIQNLFVEGGPTLLSSLFQHQLIDELQVFIAPKLLGDPSAPSAILHRQIKKMAQAQTLHLHHIKPIDNDLLLNYLLPPHLPPLTPSHLPPT